MSERFNSMFEYVADADITHYRHTNTDKDAPDILIEPFQPVDDHDFAIIWDDEIEKDGKTYIRVCWVEDEISYLAQSAMYETCYIRYVKTFSDPKDEFGEYISDGRVYDTTKEAEETTNMTIRNTGDD